MEIDVIPEVELKKITVSSTKNKESKADKIKEIRMFVKKAKVEAEKHIQLEDNLEISHSSSKKEAEEENGIANFNLDGDNKDTNDDVYEKRSIHSDEEDMVESDDVDRKNEINENDESQIDEIFYKNLSDEMERFEIVINDFKMYYNEDYLTAYLLFLF